jgi:hypothetical protein
VEPSTTRRIELPPKYEVRDYLKQRVAKMETLGTATTDTLLKGWRDAYRSHSVSTETMRRFGEEYLEYLRIAGGFALGNDYTPPSKALPSKERVTSTGFLLDPVGLGQGWWGENPNPYVENAALLRLGIARFRRKKASVGIGIGCIVLTQHLLERVYERMEIGRNALGSLIEDEFNDLLQALALAELGSLWIRRIEGDRACRVTAVPYSNGLMILNERLLLGDIEGGEFGFRLEIPSGRYQTPFINPARFTTDLGNGRYLDGILRSATITCGVTYLNALTLDRDESDYFYGFKALMDDVGEQTLNILAYHAFAPLLPHQQTQRFEPPPEIEGKIRRLSSLLNAGWLKAELSQPLCYLLPFDHEVVKSPGNT